MPNSLSSLNPWPIIGNVIGWGILALLALMALVVVVALIIAPFKARRDKQGSSETTIINTRAPRK